MNRSVQTPAITLLTNAAALARTDPDAITALVARSTRSTHGPAHQGRGIAGLLMNTALDWLGRDKPIWLNVVAHNGRAQAFYRRFGFAVDPNASRPYRAADDHAASGR
ncbi:GNAT family N-acetyltransferase [Sphingomonas sp. C3-2]|uniref:GNAT family N-acetyltransferase n=1 Tax=Sphingomonas sp. C3-2 TaxID=3062169 RepID=UPI00294AC01A|nr:GNAT family N-acetyltransferase [Sphingomonas sp. C3-2]WOK36346.1 GNAT family N-acetyltransferase [Sphingomonas sp. C3-2]